MVLAGATAAVVVAVLTLVTVNLRMVKPEVTEQPVRLDPVDEADFEREVGSLFPPAFLAGNRIDTLQNGDEIFPAMLDAIRNARRTITFETYIYWKGAAAFLFADALSARAREGVRVHLLLDWVGSHVFDQATISLMRDAGVEIALYRPLRWYNLARMNKRTHRKLLVIDGRVGFTGGVGIGDEWLGDARTPDEWREVHYRVEGPVVAQMQSAFMDNWFKTRNEILHGPGYFPPLEHAGPVSAQLYPSAALEEGTGVGHMYQFAIAAARNNIRIATAYFVPDDVTIRNLLHARERGVRIEILLPGTKTDFEIARRASRAEWGPLLEAGVEIYEYIPTMYHCKIFIVSDRFVSVGSTNFDARSFNLNDEANLNVLDRAFALEQIEIFERDRSRARRITLDEWKRRPLGERVVEKTASLFRSQL